MDEPRVEEKTDLGAARSCAPLSGASVPCCLDGDAVELWMCVILLFESSSRQV